MVERGTRYKCYKCETGFYDLGRPQPVCPACGEDQSNKEVVQTFKRKKRRLYSKVEPDIHVLPEEGEDTHEERERLSESEEDREENRDEYILEKEDIALEENTEDDSK